MTWPAFNLKPPQPPFRCGGCTELSPTLGRKLRRVKGVKTWVGACCLPPLKKGLK